MNTFSLTILITEQCNLRCNYCYERFIYKSPSMNVLDKIESLISRLSQEYLSIHISFFGGEPLLAYSKIIRIMTYCNRLQCNFSFSLTTNGVFLTYDKLENLVNLGLEQFQVTFDGNRLTHNLVRVRNQGEATFDIIYNNLLHAKNIKTNFAAIIRVNASPLNANEIIHLVNDLISDFSEDSRFKVFLRPVGKWGGSNDDKLDTLNTKDFNSLNNIFNCTLPERMKYPESTFKVCYAALPNHLLIYPDGSLGKCTVGIHDDVNKVGKINSDGSISANYKLLSYWSRGLLSKDSGQLACPYHAK